MSNQPASTEYAAWRGRLAEGIDGRFYSIEWIDALLSEGRAFFFATEEAALIVELKQFPTGLVAVHALIAAGDIDKMIEDFGPVVEQWGRDNGATVSLIESRAGWARKMRAHGYAPFQTTVAKEL